MKRQTGARIAAGIALVGPMLLPGQGPEMVIRGVLCVALAAVILLYAHLQERVEFLEQMLDRRDSS